ncbi:MAG: SDR family oxidoreductase [Lachnospiraceae bacterium]|nr:SDR family oxidoreductase [Candidatus Equihabitans merdae]
MKLEGKSIVVTGASSGMGKVIVEQYVKEGANVIAVARRAERLAELVSSLEGEAGSVIAFAGDVSKQEDCEAMIDLAVEKFGKLDVLVNNAGVMDDMATVANYTNEKYDYVMNINVAGPLYAMRKAVNVFLEQGNGGNIITTSSVGGSHQAAGVVYGASKAAVNAIVRHTAFVYRNEKIRCNAIAPGGINTEISATMGMPNIDGFTRIKGVQALMPGVGEGSDIANLAVFLASDDSAFITGQIIAVDGGWTSF